MVVVEPLEPLNLELLNRSGARVVGKLNGLNGAQRLNGLNVLNNILCRKDRDRKKSRVSIELLSATWKELSRTLMAWCNLSEPR